MLVYITYANTQAIARVWIERDELPTWAGLWWVHASLAAVGLYLLLREAGVFASAPKVETDA